MRHRVALVTAFPEDASSPRGGVEAVSVVLASALARLEDLELHVVTTDAGRRAPTICRLGDIVVHRLPRLGRTTLGGAVAAGRRQMHRYLLDLRVDLVHAHDTYGLMVKGLRLPRVFTVHGFIHGDTAVSGRRLPRLRAALWRLVETAAWADQPHIISISPYVRERLHGIARGAIYDVENPIAEPYFEVARQEAPDRILSAAVVSRRKNTLSLVEALARLRANGLDAQLRLAGAVVDAEYGARVQERVRELNLTAQVQVLGSLGSEDVRAELGRASLSALLSLEENAPLSIEEAMAAGVPVVASNRCGMPYLVRHGETGFLVNPLDGCDVTEHLATLLRDATLRQTMAERCRAVARARFHPHAVALRTRDVYYRAMGPSRCAK